jgi:hypothetical protein
MKWITSAGAFVLAGSILVGVTFAADESAQNFQLKNRIRVGWDSNVYETDGNESDSFKIIEEMEFVVNLDLEQTFLGARYRPSFVWWEDREPDDADLHHEADLVFSHTFSPRLSLSAKETLRIAELPELVDRGEIVREKDDYFYNLVDAVLGYKLSDPTRIEVGARQTLLRYDDDAVAATDDYDIYAVGLTLRQQLKRETALSAEARVEQSDYRGPDRGSDTAYLGMGVEQIFSPNLVGSVRGGWQRRNFVDEALGTEDSPYSDLSITYLPSPKTRLSGGLGYSLFESDIFPYASQDRLLTFLTLAHDLTARIQLFVASSFQHSEYHTAEAVELPEGSDGGEDVWQLSGRASYMVNRNNYLEAQASYMNFDSDLREKFDRVRLEIGWRTQL